MRAAAIILTLATVLTSCCQADVNVTDYIFWKKSDISTWSLFRPSRYIAEEYLTNQAASLAVSSLQSGLSVSLSKIVTFQYSELEIAKQIMAGTAAEGCISGISNFLDQAISDQLDAYTDCTADASSKLSRLNSNLARTNATYQAAYQRALAGIDACYKTYPNKDSIDRLRSCVESMNNNYITAAINTQNAVFPSPSMAYFQNTVVQCASTAAQAVAAKGAQFLKMLVNCAALSGTVDPTEYAEELSEWKGFDDTLAEQITTSQIENYKQVSVVENDMLYYYNVQKQALEQYVIESRGLDFYRQKIFSLLSDYYNTITITLMDNPGDSGCVMDAKNALDNGVYSGAATSLACDQAIVDDIKLKISEIYNNFLDTNNEMTYIGNVAILDCISKGYVFAPNTISKCFQLASSSFSVEYLDRSNDNTKDMNILVKYVQTFFKNSDLPCGGTSVSTLYLGANTTLYQLQRCLYESSGTTYEVTTLVSQTTSTTTTYAPTTTLATSTPVPQTTPTTITSTTTPYAPTTTLSTSTSVPHTTPTTISSTTTVSTTPVLSTTSPAPTKTTYISVPSTIFTASSTTSVPNTSNPTLFTSTTTATT